MLLGFAGLLVSRVFLFCIYLFFFFIFFFKYLNVLTTDTTVFAYGQRVLSLLPMNNITYYSILPVQL